MIRRTISTVVDAVVHEVQQTLKQLTFEQQMLLFGWGFVVLSVVMTIVGLMTDSVLTVVGGILMCALTAALLYDVWREFDKENSQ